MTNKDLYPLVGELARLGRNLADDYGKVCYQRLIEAECTTRKMSLISLGVPGVLLPPAIVATALKERREYTPERRELLRDTFIARRHLLSERKAASEICLEVVLGAQALSKLSWQMARPQAAVLKEALADPQYNLFVVEDEVIKAAHDSLEIGPDIDCTVGLEDIAGEALYVEYSFTDGTVPHEAWFDASGVYARHQEVFSQLVTQAFTPVEMRRVICASEPNAS